MSKALRLTLNAENALPPLAIALFTVFDVVAASCVALYGIKDEMQAAGHAFSAPKYGRRQTAGRSPQSTTGSRRRSLHPFGLSPDFVGEQAITPNIPQEIGT